MDLRILRTILILILLLLALSFQLSATDINAKTPHKKPKLQTLDTLPPAPEWYICPCGVNAHSKRYVYDKPDNQAIRSNLNNITLDKELSYNFKLTFGNFNPCVSCSTDWKLDFINKGEDALGVVTFTDCAGNDTTLYIEYHAFKVKLSPINHDFGMMSFGDVNSKKMFIVNESSTSFASVFYFFLKLKDEKGRPQGFTLWDSTGTKPLPTGFPINNPIIIQPLDSLPFIVKFEATHAGEFWDSIGVGDTNYFHYEGIVTALVGTPIIEVSDCQFKKTKVGTISYGDFNVKNKGTVPLIITGYNGPRIKGVKSKKEIFKALYIHEYEISSEKSLIIQPNDFITLDVIFTPDEAMSYSDSILFESNSLKGYNWENKTDSICIFQGEGIYSGLRANSYDWGRIRINRPDIFPIEPYPAIIAPGMDSVIKIYNEGNQQLSILKLINEEEIGNINAFRYQAKNLLVTLQPGNSKVVPVLFNPCIPGLHKLKFKYRTYDTLADNISTTLSGIGIIPRIETMDVNFGASIINDYDNPNIRQLRIRNLSDTEWQYGDSVTIFDIAGENISQNISSWEGDSPFRYDKSGIPFPIVLQAGEEIVFNVEFAAKQSGKVTASLTTISDAEAEVTTTLSGWDTETNVDDSRIDEITISPNPVTDKMIITNLPDDASEIRISDIFGNEIFRKKLLITNDQLLIDVSDFSQGIYFMQIITQDKVFTRKFVVLK